MLRHKSVKLQRALLLVFHMYYAKVGKGKIKPPPSHHVDTPELMQSPRIYETKLTGSSRDARFSY